MRKKYFSNNSNYRGPTLCYCIPLKNNDNGYSTLADHTKT